MTNEKSGDEQGFITSIERPRFPIPSSLRLPGSFLVSETKQEARYSANRNKLILGLEAIAGTAGIAGAAGQVMASQGSNIYKAVTGPLQMIEKGAAAGLFRGVSYDGGKIVAHAQFIKANPDIMLAATNCATQFMLISVAIQLNQIQNTLKEVQQEIERVEEYLHNDRVAEIIAGINGFRQALDMKDHKKREEVLLHVVQQLNEGVSKAVMSLRTEIQGVPCAFSHV